MTTGEADLFAEIDPFGEPQSTYRAVEIDFPVAADQRQDDPAIATGSDTDDDRDTNGDLRDSMCSEELDQAIMWFLVRRLSGDLATARGVVGMVNSHAGSAIESEKRPPTPRGMVEFYLLKNGRIVEGAKESRKSKSVIGMTFEGAEKWYRIKQKSEAKATKKPAAVGASSKRPAK